MSRSRSRSSTRVLLRAVVLGVVAGSVASSVRALPAYGNRTGLPCATCHLPVYPRLTKTGWEFRRLGYRLMSEMNQRADVHKSTDTEASALNYHYGDTISIMARMRYDNRTRQRAQKFSQFYVSDIIGFFSGPAGKNFGYFLEPILSEHADAGYVTSDGVTRYELGSSESDVEFAALKYYAGTEKGYFAAKLGQFGFGGVDGFGPNDRPISTARPLMVTTKTHGFALDNAQRGLDLGYTLPNDHLSFTLLNGVNEEGEGSTNRNTNRMDYFLQGIHWLGTEGSSVQAIYYNGRVPYDVNGATKDKFNRVYLMGNWRQPMSTGDTAVNILGGYMTGKHDRIAPATGRFTVSSYFVEGDYEIGAKTSPYLRYDTFKSGEPTATGANKNNVWTVGVAHQPEPNVRLNLEWQAIRPNNSQPKQDLLRAQVWFMW